MSLSEQTPVCAVIENAGEVVLLIYVGIAGEVITFEPNQSIMADSPRQEDPSR